MVYAWIDLTQIYIHAYTINILQIIQCSKLERAYQCMGDYQLSCHQWQSLTGQNCFAMKNQQSLDNNNTIMYTGRLFNISPINLSVLTAQMVVVMCTKRSLTANQPMNTWNFIRVSVSTNTAWWNVQRSQSKLTKLVRLLGVRSVRGWSWVKTPWHRHSLKIHWSITVANMSDLTLLVC